MKLNLLFTAMEILTVLAYPVLYVYARLQQFSRFRKEIPAAKILVPTPIAPGE